MFYLNVYIGYITKVRIDNGWELPVFKVTDKMMNMGYTDILQCFGEVKSTCKYDTRVDYVYCSQSCNIIDNVVSARVIEGVKFSDHLPVVCEFRENIIK